MRLNVLRGDLLSGRLSGSKMCNGERPAQLQSAQAARLSGTIIARLLIDAA